MAADFEVISEGLVSATVCSSLPREEVNERMARHFTGISSGWTPADEPTFSNGTPNPGPCNENPETHTHYLFHC